MVWAVDRLGRSLPYLLNFLAGGASLSAWGWPRLRRVLQGRAGGPRRPIPPGRRRGRCAGFRGDGVPLNFGNLSRLARAGRLGRCERSSALISWPARSEEATTA